MTKRLSAIELVALPADLHQIGRYQSAYRGTDTWVPYEAKFANPNPKFDCNGNQTIDFDGQKSDGYNLTVDNNL